MSIIVALKVSGTDLSLVAPNPPGSLDTVLHGTFDGSSATLTGVIHEPLADGYQYNCSLEARVVVPEPGDANGDGVVDVSDLGVLATNYGTTSGAEWADADFTGDGKVDVSDLGIFSMAYGNTIEGTSSQAVPEPSMLVGLLGLCLAGLLALARRKR